MATKTVLITSGTTWTTPAALDPTVNATVICIGAGGSGRKGVSGASGTGGGGGGGALSSSSINLTAGATVYISIGSGGVTSTTAGSNGVAGGDTWLNWNTSTRVSSNTAPTSNTTGVLAKGFKTRYKKKSSNRYIIERRKK